MELVQAAQKVLRYEYRLHLSFSAPVGRHCFTLRCTPVSDERQQLLECSREILPAGPLSSAADGFGSILLSGQINCPHTCFDAVMRGSVRTGISGGTSGSPLDGLFRYPTPLTAPDEALREAALAIPDEPDPLSTASRVMETVWGRMTYCPGATGVATTAAAAFAAGQGVCQDYTHIMLALLRLKGIPARYTVGMLIGEGETHAWAEVLSDGRWHGFDPTNCVRVGTDHIKFSHGRDYTDCQVCRGHIYGAAAQQQTVSVSVTDTEIS